MNSQLYSPMKSDQNRKLRRETNSPSTMSLQGKLSTDGFPSEGAWGRHTQGAPASNKPKGLKNFPK